MEFLEAVEQLAPARLLRSSFVAYPLVNALHIAAIGTLFAGVLLMDLAVLGAIRSIARERLLALLRPMAFGAFALAGVSGLVLFSIQATAYAQNPAFLTKLGLIALALLNFRAFTALDRKASAPTPALRLCALASILLWSGVLVAGRFIGFV